MTIALEPVHRLTKDIVKALATLTDREARYLVETYYQMQEYRKASDNQSRTLAKDESPHEALTWFGTEFGVLEDQLARALDHYSMHSIPGRWMRATKGVGPILAANFLCYLDVRRTETAGGFWSFAGLNPNVVWPSREDAEKWVAERWAKNTKLDPDAVRVIVDEACVAFGRRAENVIKLATISPSTGEVEKLSRDNLARALCVRPWNKNLKTACWKLGQSFLKLKGHADCFYAQVYAERKKQEELYNERGDFAAQAARELKKLKDKKTPTYAANSAGKLSPAHLEMRAERYAVKLFLSHLHHVMYECEFGTPPPKPYVIAQLGHAHIIAPPNWPMQ